MGTPPVNNGIYKWAYDSETNICQIQFRVMEDIAGPVYMYYRLTNFYQNNRKYVNSFDQNQLQGMAVTASEMSSNTNPLGFADTTSTNPPQPNLRENGNINGNPITPSPQAVYYPAGLIANSLFSGIYL